MGSGFDAGVPAALRASIRKVTEPGAEVVHAGLRGFARPLFGDGYLVEIEAESVTRQP